MILQVSSKINRMSDSQQMEKQFSAALQLPLVLAVSSSPIGLTLLPEAEQALINQTTHETAKNSRLMARHALKTVFERLNLSYQQLSYPHSCFSIAHHDKAGIAVGMSEKFLNEGELNVSGLGVDIELPRQIKETGWKFFLTDKEQNFVKSAPKNDWQMYCTRLWTVKEALFKATPENKENGILVAHFETDTPSLEGGIARLKGSNTYYQYQSVYDVDLGWITVAASSTVSAV